MTGKLFTKEHGKGKRYLLLFLFIAVFSLIGRFSVQASPYQAAYSISDNTPSSWSWCSAYCLNAGTYVWYYQTNYSQCYANGWALIDGYYYYFDSEGWCRKTPGGAYFNESCNDRGYNAVSVTFNANRGSGGEASCSVPSPKYSYHTSVALTPAAPSRSGFTFRGWSTDPNASSGSTSFYSPGSATTYYAIWSKTITLDQNGGSGGTTSISACIGQPMPAITIPSKTGYRFGGYYATLPAESVSVETAPGANYSFYNNGGWYYPNNQGVQSSASVSRIYFNLASQKTVTIYYYNNAESGWDYGLFGNLDSSMSTSYSDVSTGVRTKCSNSTSQQSIQYTVPAGSHFIDVKYRKNGSVNSGDDRLWFTVSCSTSGATNKQFYTASGASNATWEDYSISTLTASWTANTYTVQYNANGGTGTTASSSHTYDSSKKLTKNGYTRTGYSFAGWSTDSSATTATYSDRQSVTNLTATHGGTVTLYAVWTPHQYTVVYNGNENTGGSTKSSTHYYGTAKKLTKNGYTRTGYAFQGWATTSGGGATYSDQQNVTNLTSTNGGTVTLYAVWKALNYTVNFNKNGGSGTMNAQTIQYDKATALNAVTFSRSGYTFSSWNTKANGAGTSYSNQESVTNLCAAGSSITLYARWTANKYTITFDRCGGSGGSGTATATYDAAMPAITSPSKTGYIFNGYYTGTGGSGTKYYNANGTSAKAWDKTSNTTLYAYWTPITYTIHFEKNFSEATGTMADQTFTYDQAQALSANQFNRVGYLFDSWTTNPDGSGSSYANRASILNMTSVNGQTITLYAKWVPITFYVVFDGNNSTSGSMPQKLTFTYDQTQQLPANVFSRIGYEFGGWTERANGTGNLFEDSAIVKNLTDRHNTTVTLYAKWNAKRYIVKFTGNGATSGSMENQTFLYDEEKALSTNAFARTGYTFSHWKSVIEGTPRTFTNGQVVKSLTPVEGLILTMDAQWTANNYTVRYHGGSSDVTGSMADQPMTYDSSAKLTANGFSKAGYSFAGWSRTQGGSVQYSNQQNVSNLTSAANGTVDLYAVWTANTITISLEKKGGTGGTDGPIFLHYDDAWYSDATHKNQITSISIPTRTGYTFDGYWFGSVKEIAADGTILAANNSHSTDATLTAKWKTNHYQVRFNKNDPGATGVMSPQTLTYDSNAFLTTNGFAKVGYNFVKWTTNPDGTGNEYQDGAEVLNLLSADGSVIDLYANWTSNLYTVTFNKNDALATGTMTGQTFRYDESQRLKDVEFTKVGYHFDHWNKALPLPAETFLNRETVTNLTTEKDGTVELKAVWTANNYTVRYNKNSLVATGTMSDDHFIYDTSAALSLNQFERTGYIFSGWNTNPDGTGQLYSNTETVINLTTQNNGVVTLYAVWTPINYSIHFDKNFSTATGTMDDQVLTYDVSEPIDLNGFDRPGYLFDGWALSSRPSATDIRYFDGEIIKNLSSTDGDVITFYAQWIGNAYTIEFMPNAEDAVGQMGNQNVVYDVSAALSPNRYSRNGYRFASWNTMPDGNGTSYADKTVVVNLTTGTGTTKLYAQWEPNTYSIVYNKNANLATGTTASTPMTYTVPGTIAANGFTNAGYTFHSWNSKLDGHGTTYQPGDSVLNLTSTENGRFNLYAIWVPISYTVKYDKNSALASGTMNDDSHTYGSTYNLAENSYEYAGYAFTGWNTKADGTGTAYRNKQSVRNMTTTAGATITLFAQWSPIVYTVSFGKNDTKATGVMADITLHYDEQRTLPANTFSKLGYRFSKWNTSADGSGTDYSDKQTVKNLVNTIGTVNLYAQWAPISYTVKFHSNDSLAKGSMAPQSFDYDERDTLTANAFTKEGYVFDSWNTKEDGSGTVYNNEQAIKNLCTTDGEEFNLYAQWTKIRYFVAFDGNGSTGGTMATITCYYDESYTLATNAFVKTGYNFEKWNTALDGTGVTVLNRESIRNLSTVPDQTVTLYAQWKANTYSVVFDGNGSTSGTMPDQAAEYNKKFNLSENQYSRIGYSFAGWSDHNNATTALYADKAEVGNLTIANNGKVTLYAVWKPYTYTVRLQPGASDVTGTMTDQTFSYGESKALSKNMYSRSGSVFKGWNLTPGNDPLYLDKAIVKNLTVDNEAVVTLYAQWGSANYTVIFNGNDATGGTMPTQSFVYGTSQELLPNNFVKTGYEFAGWNTEANGEGTPYPDAAEASNLTDTDGASVTLYAQWSPVECTISYEMNGSEFVEGYTPVTTRNYEDLTPLPTASCIRKDGSVFLGWYDNQARVGSPITVIPKNTGNVELYAKFREYTAAEYYAYTDKEIHSFSFSF